MGEPDDQRGGKLKKRLKRLAAQGQESNLKVLSSLKVCEAKDHRQLCCGEKVTKTHTKGHIKSHRCRDTNTHSHIHTLGDKKKGRKKGY